MLVCEVLQFGLGQQLFAGLPVVTEARAVPCKNICFSQEAPALSANAKN